MDARNLAGSLKAAILIQALGKEVSGVILNSLDETERGLIESHLSQMGQISLDLVEKVAEEFTSMAASKVSLQIEEKGDSTALESKPSQLEALQALEPDNLLELIKDEHPQTMAIIIAHLKTGVASEVLDRLPDEIRTEVAIRIANLDKVISGMIEEVGRVFENILKNKEDSASHKTGGVDRLAEIINQITGTSAQVILDEIEERDVELAEEIKQRMFVFEDLPLVDDKGLQKVLRKVESKELATALKAASEEVKQKVFRNMSQRAGEMLREEVEEIGAVRMTEVENAQQMITKIIQELESKGEVVISGRGGDEIIV